MLNLVTRWAEALFEMSRVGVLLVYRTSLECFGDFIRHTPAVRLIRTQALQFAAFSSALQTPVTSLPSGRVRPSLLSTRAPLCGLGCFSVNANNVSSPVNAAKQRASGLCKRVAVTSRRKESLSCLSCSSEVAVVTLHTKPHLRDSFGTVAAPLARQSAKQTGSSLRDS